jgi:pimeloyl-ACP methyl ester carboxylesterase
VVLPPGRVVHLEGLGDVFVRDTGGAGVPVLLLHGWMFSGEMNWWPVYDALAAAGFRAISIDHRGHGRGLRTLHPFRLADCAGDAAALLRALGTGPAIVAGYSMGGPIASLLARDHPDLVSGLILCATARSWRHPQSQAVWRTLSGLRLLLGLFPIGSWEALLTATRVPPGPQRTWVAAELTRGSSRDIAEAGRELSRFDSTGWLGSLRDVPAAVVVTGRDRSVPPREQRAMAEGLGAPTFDVPADHMAVGSHPEDFLAAFMAALRAVAPPAAERRAAA